MTIVEPISSLLVGQVTLSSSDLTSFKNFIILPKVLFPLVLTAGQEGLEPPASGFGDRRSTSWSYWPVIYYLLLSGFLMHNMFIAEGAIFPIFHPFRMKPFVFGHIIITPFTFITGQYNLISWHNLVSTFYSIISAMTPAPTVRPPSRIAKRRPSSIAIGVINSPSKETLSPGMTISTFSGSLTVPVTSVVRK